MQDETRSRLEPRLSPIAPLIYRFILDDNRPIFGQRSPPDRPAAQRAQETGGNLDRRAAPGSVLRLLSTAAIRLHGKPIRCIRERGAEIIGRTLSSAPTAGRAAAPSSCCREFHLDDFPLSPLFEENY